MVIVAYVDDTKVLWDNLKERFSQENAPRIYQLKNQMSLLRQDGLSIASFSAKMRALWDKLDNCARARDRTCGATCNYAKEKETDKLYQFLMGLIGDPLPTLGKSYSMVMQGERHQMVANEQEKQVQGATSVVEKKTQNRAQLVGIHGACIARKKAMFGGNVGN